MGDGAEGSAKVSTIQEIAQRAAQSERQCGRQHERWIRGWHGARGSVQGGAQSLAIQQMTQRAVQHERWRTGWHERQCER